MNVSSKSSLLAEELTLLVKHFGIQRVQGTLGKISRSLGVDSVGTPSSQKSTRVRKSTGLKGTHVLNTIREIDPEKYRQLSEFLYRIQDRQVLPSSQDIRYFAQNVGLKDLTGKSREELIPKLMRFLVDRPTFSLRHDLASAEDISERQRNMGFSVLTDKLVGKR